MKKQTKKIKKRTINTGEVELDENEKIENYDESEKQSLLNY